MKTLFFIICVVFAGDLFSQTNSEQDIVGVYNLKSNDPMGGGTMVFLADKSYVISYFGGIQKGSWEYNKGEVILTVMTEPQFALYGRKLSSLGKKSQVSFQVEPHNGTAVGLDSDKKTSLRPVFNEDANCFSFPYIFTQEKEIVQLHAAQLGDEISDFDPEDNPFDPVYHFNILGVYNDLILINLSSEYTRKSSAIAFYKDGKLYMGPDDDEGTRKSPLESLNEEDSVFINQLSGKSLLPNQLEYGDEFFPYTENPTEEELQTYHRIEVLEISREDIVVEEKSYFYTSCDKD